MLRMSTQGLPELRAGAEGCSLGRLALGIGESGWWDEEGQTEGLPDPSGRSQTGV